MILFSLLTAKWSIKLADHDRCKSDNDFQQSDISIIQNRSKVKHKIPRLVLTCSKFIYVDDLIIQT